jgi:hypothetical protein
MCWNQYVSLNTFVFGVFVLILIAFNNRYSQYKIKEFENPYTYFFMVSFISMQFIEFILWRNLNNPLINKIFSILGSLLLVIQPIASLLMLKDIPIRNKLLGIYTVPAFIYSLYMASKTDFNTTISKTGHLKWNWINTNYSNVFAYAFYLFFLYYSPFVNKNYIGIIFTLASFAMYYYLYYTEGSSGSLWCWSVNIIMLYYLIKLLIYLPYQEKGLC